MDQIRKDNLTAKEINQKIQADMLEKSLKKRAEQSEGSFSYVDLRKTPVNTDIFGLIDVQDLKNAQAIPYFRLGRKLVLACVDPKSLEVEELVKKLVEQEFEIQLSITSKVSLDYLMRKVEEFQLEKKAQDLKTYTSNNVEVFEKELSSVNKIIEKIEPSTIKEGLREVIIGAIRVNASDIHFQPQEKSALIRFRVDGILQSVGNLKNEIYKSLSQQIKFESGMKINVSDVPQDGRFGFMLNDRKIDLRVSSIPSEYGDNVVIRILDSGRKFATYTELGFAERHLKILEKAEDLKQGMILITGPTGSGKTTTLYSMLNEINTTEKKIITLEDPIEYHLDRIVQSQIREDKGYSFDKALESVLRQDPDVVMVGEIRNLEVAQTAMQAALTGHVVLSTLHTNSAMEAIPRLTNMGVENFMVAPAIDILMAQRLVRKVCPFCSKKDPIEDDLKNLLESELVGIKQINPDIKVEMQTELPSVVGCSKCNFTGYKGRIILAEIIEMDDELKGMILENKSFIDLKNKAQSKGNLSMYQDGILKVIEGKTTLLEVQRVINN